MDMAEKRDTFEELVKSLAISERREMLDRLVDASESDSGVSATKAATESSEQALADAAAKHARFSEVGFFVRLWFKLLAFLSSCTAEEKYNEHLVAELGRKLGQKYGTYFSASKRIYTSLLYKDLVFLESFRTFFLPYINEYDKRRGDFYILLSSLIAPETAAEISATLDPSSEPYETESVKDIHSAFSKKMDDVFERFPAEEKRKMYQAAQSAEWIVTYESLSLNRTILQFADTTGDGQMCPIDMLTDDFKKISSVLYSAEKIPVHLLEAFFIFMNQDKVQDEAFSFDRECTDFVRTAVNNLTEIANFRTRVPLADFVRFSSGDISWEPEPERGGEDWFKLFRVAWKERFEKRFSEWAKLRDKHMLKKRALAFLERGDSAELEFIPWQNSWIEFKFSREAVLLFLKSFFSGVYPRRMSKILRVILAEGDFYKRENLSEFTDGFNTLEHCKRDIDEFEMRLAPNGDIGADFALALNEKAGTHSGNTRLKHLMATVESDAESLCTRVINAMKSLDLVLGGILNVSQGGQYDTLSNLSSIQGVESADFRTDIVSVKYKIEECLNIINELSMQ